MRWTSMILAAWAVLLFAGCKMSPEALCKRQMAMYKAAREGQGKKLSDDSVKKKTERCVEKAKKLKESEPKYYDCVAKCTKDVSSWGQWREKCGKGCAKEKK
ncbi:MAG: hypothetical protein KC609_05985 [Myxococcales bacterium]|nr:hypothetical protein [Myxococcales bacterium]